MRLGIFRERWLPLSESFIADQQRELGRHLSCVPICLARTGADPRPGADAVRAYTASTGRAAPRLALGVGRTLGVLPAAAARWRLAELDAALVHFGPDAAFFLPFLRRARIPFAVLFHGYDATLSDAALTATSRATRTYRDRRRRVFDEAALLLAVSQFVAGRIVEQGAPAGKVGVHYLGVAADVGPPPPWSQRRGITFVGRLVEKKGAADLLAAVAMQPEGLRSTPVDVVGDGPLLPMLRDVARAERLDVTFHGARPHDEALAAMCRARVFCVPSSTARNGDAEGLGLVFLEAAARGTPVVSYRSGGVPEAVRDGETGLLAPEGDVPGLAERLRAVLTDDARWARLSGAGVEHVRRRFDRAAHAAALARTLTAMAGG
jgi:colanic acid/amylovoran biosynthesis glycosyltransferase